MQNVTKILIALLIINIILFLLILFGVKKIEMIRVKNFEDYIAYEEGVWPNEDELETQNYIYIENMGEIFNIYNGKIPISRISTKIEYIVNENLKKILESEEDSNLYFKSNYNDINKIYGIDDIVEFKQFVDKFKMVKNQSIESVKIKEGTTEIKEEVLISQIDIKFSNNINVILKLEVDDLNITVKIY